MESPDAARATTVEGLGQAVRFLSAVRQNPELIRRFREETFDLEELVVLGEQLGFRFNGVALQQAFHYDFQLRLAVQQSTTRSSFEMDRQPGPTA